MPQAQRFYRLAVPESRVIEPYYTSGWVKNSCLSSDDVILGTNIATRRTFSLFCGSRFIRMRSGRMGKRVIRFAKSMIAGRPWVVCVMLLRQIPPLFRCKFLSCYRQQFFLRFSEEVHVRCNNSHAWRQSATPLII